MCNFSIMYDFTIYKKHHVQKGMIKVRLLSSTSLVDPSTGMSSPRTRMILKTKKTEGSLQVTSPFCLLYSYKNQKQQHCSFFTQILLN